MMRVDGKSQKFNGERERDYFEHLKCTPQTVEEAGHGRSDMPVNLALKRLRQKNYKV